MLFNIYNSNIIYLKEKKERKKSKKERKKRKSPLEKQNFKLSVPTIFL